MAPMVSAIIPTQWFWGPVFARVNLMEIINTECPVPVESAPQSLVVELIITFLGTTNHSNSAFTKR